MVGAGRAGQLGESQEAKPKWVVAFSVNFLVHVLARPLSGACAAPKRRHARLPVRRALLLQHVAADATLSTTLFCKIQAERQAIAPKREEERGKR